MKLKICGMKHEDNITAIAGLYPDYLGFIFYEPSPRCFNKTIPELDSTIKKVGVFVDASIEYIVEQCSLYQLSAVQLHGKENPEYCQLLKKQLPLKTEIIKVFSIKDSFDFTELTPYEACCNYFLFDTKGPLPGGNGYTFDWSVLTQYPLTTPYFLSGGIGLKEVNAIKEFIDTSAAVHCHALDVNSKFEIEPGLKNYADLQQFINQLNTVVF